ncbi:MAG: methylmalonyl-CoA epimerase [Myxococcota bacterium]
MIKHIDHIGIAVESIEEATPLYRDTLGMAYEGEDIVEEQGVRVAFFRAGEVLIELLEPLAPDTPVGKFLAKRGEGIHHLAFRVEEIGAARDDAERKGIRLLSDAPLDGAHGKLITFMHPKDTFRVLMELTQRRHSDGDSH